MRRRWSDRSSRRVRTLVTQLARSRLVRESGRMRADTHDGPEQTLQSEAGYSNARPHQPGRRNLLHRTAGPYRWVMNGPMATSTLSPFHSQQRTSVDVAKVPAAEVQLPHWLILLSFRQCLGDLAGAVNKELRHWTKRSVLQCDDTDGPRGYAKFHRQYLQG